MPAEQSAVHTVQEISTLRQFSALECEWRDLEHKLPHVPFVSFDWIRTWWDRLHAERVGLRDRLYMKAFRDLDGQLVGIAPLMLTYRPSFGPIQVRELQFVGADPNITEIRGVIAAAKNTACITLALLQHLKQRQHEWDFMQLTGVPGHVASSLALDGFGSVRWVEETPNYILPLGASWVEFKQKLSKNIKESLRKCYNAPRRDGIEFEFEVIRDPAEVGHALDVFLRLHEARAGVQGTVRHPNVFQSAEAQEFLREVGRRFSRNDRLRIFNLTHHGAVVATRIGFVCEETLYLYFSGYDPAWAKYSVMTRVVGEAIQWAISEGLRAVNLSTGRDVSKLRWGPEEFNYRTATIVSKSPRSGIVHNAYSLLKTNLQRSGRHFAQVLSR